MTTGRGRSQATRGKNTRRTNISPRLVPDSPMPVTPPSTLSVPHSSSPTPDSLSPSSLESQTLVATVERVSSTSTYAKISTQKRGPRGEYLNKNIPKDPSERKLIHIIGPSEYLEACAPISITKDFKAHFRGTQTQWSKLDDDFVDLLYQCFLDRYQYEETVDPKEARKVWVRRAMERCRGTWAKVRINCKKKSGSSNKAAWTNFRPEFVNIATDWDVILESWMKLDWVKRSKAGAENRKSVPGDVEGTSSYVRHTAGSKSFRAHTLEEETRTGKQASKVHMFERLHKRNKGKGVWCDTRSEKAVTSYKESINIADGVDLDSPDGVDLDSPSDIPFNSKAWKKAIGDPKKKNYYGHGITQDREILHGHGTSVDSTPVNNEAIIEARVKAGVESGLEGVREEMRAEMRKMFDDQQKAMSSTN